MEELVIMVPHLQRFYGGAPEQWFTMEGWMLQLYLDQLPVVEAREALWQARNVALGSGTMKSSVHRRQMQALQRQAGHRAHRPHTQAAYEGHMQMLGIPIEYRA